VSEEQNLKRMICGIPKSKGAGMKYPNMIDPTKKDMEQLGAIRHYLDNRTEEPEFHQTDTEATITAVMIIYLLIAFGLVFTGIGAVIGLVMLGIAFVVYIISKLFGL
jgi:cytochrome b subunit of formate dehydrogenase